MVIENQRLRIVPSLLEEMQLLFEAPSEAPLPNGNVDAGFNCYAKAFTTVYLARLQGIAADHCAGRALLVWVQETGRLAGTIEPHAWAGVRSGGAIDLSINNFRGAKFFSVGHVPVAEALTVTTQSTFDAREFEHLKASSSALPVGAYLFYHSQARRFFNFSRLREPMFLLNSPPTLALMERHGKNAVLAKALLHLHWLLTGQRQPMEVSDQNEAWSTLASWRIDAFKELKAEWRAAWRNLPAVADDEQAAG
ncbi:MAG: hypothetical protein ABIZ49_12590 [Opitutaceae bacterium]